MAIGLQKLPIIMKHSSRKFVKHPIININRSFHDFWCYDVSILIYTWLCCPKASNNNNENGENGSFLKHKHNNKRVSINRIFIHAENGVGLS